MMIRQLQRRLTIILTALTGTICVTVGVIAGRQTINQQEALNETTFINNVNTVMTGMNLADVEEDREWINKIEKQNDSILFVKQDGEELEFRAGYDSQTPRDELYALAQAKIAAEELRSITGKGVAEVMVMNSFETTAKDLVISDSFIAPNGFDTVAAKRNQEHDMRIDDKDSGKDYTYSSKEAEPKPMEPAESETAILGTVLLTLSETNVVDLEGDYGDRYRMKYMDMKTDNNETFSFILLQDKSKETNAIAMIYVRYGLIMLLGLTVLGFVNGKLAALVVKPVKDGLGRQTEFVASASHELRSPLAVIRSCLTAAEIVDNEKDAVKYRKNAEAEAERMSRLVEDLLLLAGGDSGKWTVHKEMVDLDTLLIEIVEQFAPLVQAKNCILDLTLPDDVLGVVCGDQERLKQVLVIFLNNALEYAPEKSVIEMWVERKKSNIELCVADHGKGITAEEKQRIFERFYRSDKSRTSKAHFGLGLAVAKELAALHGGDIIIIDTPGGGATFKLQLPYPIE